MRSARSNTVTVCPALLSCAAAARPAGPEPTTATFLPVRFARRLGDDPALLEALVDDRALDALDRHRRLVDAEHARPFARRRADAAGELGEVVGLVQPVERLAPEAAIDEVVPLGDQVVDRAARRPCRDQRARVAERNAAVHAARALLLQRRLGQVLVELVPVARRAACGSRAHGGSSVRSILHEAGRLAHALLRCPAQPQARGARGVRLEGGHLGLFLRQAGWPASSPAPRARACSRSASPARTIGTSWFHDARISSARFAAGQLRVARRSAPCTSRDLFRVLELAPGRPSPCCSGARTIAASSSST